MKTFETQAFFAYHHVNAFEVNSELVLDVLAYENAGMANGKHGFLFIDNMKNEQTRMKQEREGSVWRFRLNLEDEHTSYVIPEKKILNDERTRKFIGFELATVSPDYQSCEYRYCYGFNGFCHGNVSNSFMDWSLVKQDVSNGSFQIWFEERMYNYFELSQIINLTIFFFQFLRLLSIGTYICL